MENKIKNEDIIDKEAEKILIKKLKERKRLIRNIVDTSKLKELIPNKNLMKLIEEEKEIKEFEETKKACEDLEKEVKQKIKGLTNEDAKRIRKNLNIKSVGRPRKYDTDKERLDAKNKQSKISHDKNKEKYRLKYKDRYKKNRNKVEVVNENKNENNIFVSNEVKELTNMVNNINESIKKE